MMNYHRKGTIFEKITVMGSRMCYILPIIGIFIKWWGVEGVNA